ncbi:MAG: hypothetical protein ABI675_21915 [Chitinophagaceae bacterium]
MKLIHLTLFISILLFAACLGNKLNNMPSGLWKLYRIEVLRDNELTKTIDAGYQCWKFYKADSIEISDKQEIQKCLKIKCGKNYFNSVDRISGVVIDEFVIEKYDKKVLELSSFKKMDEKNYTILYYLEKISETEVGKEIH